MMKNFTNLIQVQFRMVGNLNYMSILSYYMIPNKFLVKKVHDLQLCHFCASKFKVSFRERTNQFYRFRIGCYSTVKPQFTVQNSTIFRAQ